MQRLLAHGVAPREQRPCAEQREVLPELLALSFSQPLPAVRALQTIASTLSAAEPEQRAANRHTATL